MFKVGILLSYASLSADGYVNDVFRTRDTTGATDPSFYFSINFYGAPALSLKEFKHYQKNTIIGFTFKLTAPLGAYDTDKIINIGTNRWSFEPGIGISQAIGNWTLETSAMAIYYTDNNEFDTDKTREQAPIYSTQFHVTYSFPHKIWAAISATYFTGGQTTVEGVTNNDLQQNWRTGTNYDAVCIAWQYRWGGGI